jgi:hypothetical protein
MTHKPLYTSQPSKNIIELKLTRVYSSINKISSDIIIVFCILNAKFNTITTSTQPSLQYGYIVSQESYISYK